ncbi:MAG: hypothetical protein QOE51_2369, partial [Actinoplanes sp.]|nr:hypothetical protein [Actinoplanes sp.]
RLREMGYRLGQGFLMARPLPAEQAGALMAPAAEPIASAGLRGAIVW